MFEKRLVGKKIAIFVEFNYEDLEIHYPFHRLKEEGATVVLIGPKSGVEYKGKYGYPCKSDTDIGSVLSKDFDALICPGGFCPDYLRRDKRFLDFIREMNTDGKPIASICHGPWMLCSAKILKGRKMTSFIAIKDDVENAGAEWIDQDVVVDGNLISSRTPHDLIVFTQAIIKSLCK
jgi:protease I